MEINRLSDQVRHPDPDEDEIIDYAELKYGTNPEFKDSDYDGISDMVELLSWTSLLKRDSDFDGLPDGVIDGWGLDYNKFKQGIEEWGMYGTIDWSKDWKAEPWEGEDLNGNGIIEAGESNPTKNNSDLDIMLDGYERWFSLDPLVVDGDRDVDYVSPSLGPKYMYTHPWEVPNDATVVGDGLNNHYEYIVGTNPREPDTDRDDLLDGGEVPVKAGINAIVMRTNVPDGAKKFDNYGSIALAGGYEWLWVNGREYGYLGEVLNPPGAFSGVPEVNIFEGKLSTKVRFVAILKDKAVILMKTDGTEVYVWEPYALMKSSFYGADNNDIAEGLCYVYSRYSSMNAADTSPSPLLQYRTQEIYFSDPLWWDSDMDKRIDGFEIEIDTDYSKDGVINPWDVDRDGWNNARDMDSDGDTIHDVRESWLNPYNPDSDGDLIRDDKDKYPMDYDNDGLTGYPAFWNIYAPRGSMFKALLGQEKKYGTSATLKDSDGDGLWDGDEVGLVDLVEPIPNLYITDPNSDDTDDDGLLDGYDVDTKKGELSGWEIGVVSKDKYTATSNPTLRDTDGDDLEDGEEYCTTHTDPNKIDTDGDGYDDKTETNKGTDPLDSGSVPVVAKTDADGDGMLDDWESDNNAYDPMGNPDNDGLSNLLEFQHGTNPNNPDSDGDGMPDGWEGEHKFNPLDGSDGAEDRDDDGLSNTNEYNWNTNVDNKDTDEDGLPDGWIDGWGYDSATRTWGIVKEEDGEKDPKEGEDRNNNGAMDADETNPKQKDTDGDSINDGAELITIYSASRYSLDTPVPIPNLKETYAYVDNLKFYGIIEKITAKIELSEPRCGYFWAELGYSIDGGWGVMDLPGVDYIKGETYLEYVLYDASKPEEKVFSPQRFEETHKWRIEVLGEIDFVEYIYEAEVEPPTDFGKLKLFEIEMRGYTNPREQDTDGDGVNDGTEDQTDLTNPLDPWDNELDSDGDTINDFAEENTYIEDSNTDWNGDGTIDHYTDPNNPDTDGDGSYDNVEILFSEMSGTGPLVYQTTIIAIVRVDTAIISQLIYPFDGKILPANTISYTEYKANSNEPAWAPLAKQLAPHIIYEDINQELPTSIFFDENRDMGDNGVPMYWPGSTRSRGLESEYGTNVNGGWYALSVQEKLNKRTTYIVAVKEGNYLGIKYFFYHPYHTGPNKGEAMAHDWWYFWVVYDMNAHAPKDAIYDFHHIRYVKNFNDISRDGFHPKVWSDAGGHRCLWSKPEGWETIPIGVILKIMGYKLKTIGVDDIADIMTHITNYEYIAKKILSLLEDRQIDKEVKDYLFDIYVLAAYLKKKDYVITEEIVRTLFVPFHDDIESKFIAAGGAIAGFALDAFWDLVVGVLVWLIHREIDKFSVPVIAPWRQALGGGWGDDHFDVGQQHNVEDFQHWVYVYGWEKDYDNYDPSDTNPEPPGEGKITPPVRQRVSRIMYVGDNIYESATGTEVNWLTKEEEWIILLDQYLWPTRDSRNEKTWGGWYRFDPNFDNQYDAWVGGKATSGTRNLRW